MSTRKPAEWKIGERITAQHLNEMRRESMRSRSTSVVGPNVAVVGSNLGSAAAAHLKPGIQLVVARQDFDSGSITDGYPHSDKTPSGKCSLMKLDSSQNPVQYVDENENIMPTFRVWDPLSELTGSPTKKQGDIFYIAWNKDTQRAEVMQGTGIQIRHGLVGDCLGMGWYTVELMDCIQFEPPDCENFDPYSGSDLGSGSGSAGTDGCDLCEVNPDDPCAEADGIPDLQLGCAVAEIVTAIRPRKESKCYPLYGNNTFVYALDKRIVPLKKGGMVTIAWFGDTCSGGSGWETGCGPAGSESGSNPQTGDQLWVVLNGEYQTVSIPYEKYECCEDGTVKRVQCTMFIVEGTVCVGPEDPCPTSSGSGSGSDSGSGSGDPGAGTGGGGGTPTPEIP